MTVSWLDRREEVEDALSKERAGRRVVLGEVVLRAGIHEQLRAVDGVGETLGELDVLVTLQDVELEFDAVRPRRGPVVAPLTERQRRVAEHSSLRARSRLCKRLRGQHSEREADVDDLVRQRLD